jgi:threonine synthase
MNYISTRGQSPATTLGRAIGAGLAPDGGLYIPATMPRMKASDFHAGDSLAQTAARLLAPFFAGDPLAAELPAICNEAFGFRAPLRAMPFAHAHILELFHGPTAAFKDFGARFLAAVMRRLRDRDSPALTILVATSGDTGAAVGAAFHKVPGIRVVILYPDQRVSPRQAHQLGCFGDNVAALRVAGTFDNCQRMVKAALSDPTVQEQRPMTSANSISLGRLLPQMSYYAHAALAWARDHDEPLDLIVPTGNLGNAVACLWVRAMGLPIGRVLFACNANPTLPSFFAGSPYHPREALATLANAMDVGAPSNFERLRALFADDASLRSACHAESVDDAEIRDVIHRHAAAHGEVFCPHTATAVRVMERRVSGGDRGPWTIVATAHPAKFDSIVEPLAGCPIAVPAPLRAMLARPSTAEPMTANDDALHQWLLMP